MQVKCGREEYEITSKDIIMDNGSCIQVLNRINMSFNTLMISRKTFNKLLKDGSIEFFKEEKGWVIGGLKYYKMKEGIQMNLEIQQIRTRAYEKLQKTPKIKREYEKYKRNFINNDGWSDGYELMTFEEYKNDDRDYQKEGVQIATRELLHKSKLEDFKTWLIKEGWTIQELKGYYEVLRAKKLKETLIVYKKLNMKEHYSVSDKDVNLVYKFINSYKKEV